MNKRQKTAFWVIVILLIGGGALAAFLTHRSKVSDNKTPDGKPVTNGGANFSDPLNPSLVLKKGDAGQNVKALQQYINYVIKNYGFNISTLVPDGVFGSYTEAAISAISKKLFTSTSLEGFKKYVAENVKAPFNWNPGEWNGTGTGMSTPTYTGS